MMELRRETRAGIPLERGQLGIYELEALAAIVDREEAQRTAMMAAGRALGG